MFFRYLFCILLMELIYKVHLKFIIIIMNFSLVLINMNDSAASITFMEILFLYITVKLDFDIGRKSAF